MILNFAIRIYWLITILNSFIFCVSPQSLSFKIDKLLNFDRFFLWMTSNECDILWTAWPDHKTKVYEGMASPSVICGVESNSKATSITCTEYVFFFTQKKFVHSLNLMVYVCVRTFGPLPKPPIIPLQTWEFNSQIRKKCEGTNDRPLSCWAATRHNIYTKKEKRKSNRVRDRADIAQCRRIFLCALWIDNWSVPLYCYLELANGKTVSIASSGKRLASAHSRVFRFFFSFLR